jgi:asparagine synthase (glutamine-hydrolysing)
MRSSTELREPFLDHRLFELALRQPPDRKIGADTGKLLLRQMVARMVPHGVVTAPKRPLQTPQREWLRGPLNQWARDRIDGALGQFGGSWLDTTAVETSFRSYRDAGDESSFHIWQWIGLGMMPRTIHAVAAPSSLDMC